MHQPSSGSRLIPTFQNKIAQRSNNDEIKENKQIIKLKVKICDYLALETNYYAF